MEESRSRILLVTVHNVLYPITMEVLYQLFSPYGNVEKIVRVENPVHFQALVQYQLRCSAIRAKTSLHGRNIYDNCCKLDIQFSTLNELKVHYDDDYSRDFTNPYLTTEQEAIRFGDRSVIDGVEAERSVILASLQRIDELLAKCK